MSLLTIDNGVFEVQATAGDTHLGGEDFGKQRSSRHALIGKQSANNPADQRIINYFTKRYNKDKKYVVFAYPHF